MNWLVSVIATLTLTTSSFADIAACSTKKKAHKVSATQNQVSVPMEVQADLLEQTSEIFAHVAETSMPATVSIKGVIHQPQQQQFLNPFDMFGDELFRRFFGGSPFQNNPQFQQQPQQQITGGSGFFISADGYLVTNNHVIQNAEELTVTTVDGREYSATVVGSDPRTDLAVLKIEETNLPFLSFGDSEKTKIGNWVVAIGNPFGLEATLTVGVVSAKGRQGLGLAPYEDYIQTDAAINPGNSGGPLLNLRGEVVGVNSAIYTRSGGYMGIGLAIPSRMVQTVIEQIRTNGVVKRAFIGVILQPLDKELANALGAEKQEGIFISEVLKDSPAAAAGILQGDVITELDGKVVKNVNKFRNDIAFMAPGTEITLGILRNHEAIQIHLQLGAQSETEALSAEAMEKIGIEVETLTPEIAANLGLAFGDTNGGVVITKIKPNSPAAAAGLRTGFLITGIALDWANQKWVPNVAAFQDALKEVKDKKHLILIVRHQNFQRYYTIKLG